MQGDFEQGILLPPRAEKIVSALYPFWQKAIELLFVVVGLILLCLILPFLSLIIYIDSPGPIFYTQERLGYQGKKFRIFKLRSMHINAEGDGRAIWAAINDTRVTRVGRLIRATHLDELPQVFNILRGEMTLIGPRPEREELVSELEKPLPTYRSRLVVKPGLTGWAQVKYHYTNSEEETRIKLYYDLYYIEHRSIKMDIKILLYTVVEVLLRHGT